jgi:broad specificity phosphatase PhoE
MARFVLIRHGESIWNGERRIQGNQDPPLSPRGRRQAELLAARLHAHLPKAAAIYTSPLRRAAETAQVVGAATGLSVIHVRVNDTCHLTEAGADLVPKDVLTDAGDPADIAP